jgi:hypothetical protein
MNINSEEGRMEVRICGLLDVRFGGTEENYENIKWYTERDLNRTTSKTCFHSFKSIINNKIIRNI